MMTLLGVAGTLQGLDAALSRIERSKPAVLDYIGRQIINYAKVNRPWVSRTGEAGLLGAFEHDPHHGDYAGLKAPVLIVANTKEYAVHVENKSGYWVLSGAIYAMKTSGQLKGMMVKMLGDGLHGSTTWAGPMSAWPGGA